MLLLMLIGRTRGGRWECELDSIKVFHNMLVEMKDFGERN